MRLPTFAIRALAVLLLAGCPKPPVELNSLSVTPDEASLARGESVQFVATAWFSDGQVKDVTAETLWSVDDAFVGAASADTQGLVQALGVGQSVVRARYGGKTITRPLIVAGSKLEAIQLDPPHPVLPVGLGVALAVTAIRTDGSKADVTAEVIWTVSSPALAQVEGATLYGRAPGTLTLTASVQGHTVTVPVDVTNASIESLDVQPAALVLPVNVSRALGATAILSDGSSLDVTKQARWSSAAEAVAFVSNLPGEEGVVVGRGAGKARVTATVLGQSGQSELTVHPTSLVAVELSPPADALALGTSQQFTATGLFADGTRVDLTAQATWTSSAPALLSVRQGFVQGLALGTALLSVRFGDVSASREVRVSSATLSSLQLLPAPAVVAMGLTLDLRALGTFSDGSQQDLTQQVTWRATDVTIASVSNAHGTAGRVTGRAVGLTELSASLGAVAARTSLTVSAAQLVMVQVAPSTITLARGQSRAFTATGLFSDGTSRDVTSQATWSSSDVTKVTVSSQSVTRGLARAVNQGTAELRASLSGQVGRANVTVTDAVLSRLEVSPQDAALPLGLATRFVVVGRYTDGSTADLTSEASWTSSAPNIAAASNAPGSIGEVRALALGQAVVSAQVGAIVGSANLSVTSATLQGLELSPPNATIAVGLTRDFTVLGSYSDGATRDVTSQVRFSTTDASLASVSASPSFARVVGQGAGHTRLVASLAGLTAEAPLTITPAQLSSLSISPNTLTLARGTHGQLAVEATWSDGSTGDVTTQVAFSSTDLSIVTVSSAAGSAGELTSIGVGTATVRAQLGQLTASMTVTVSAATLVALEVTPTTPHVPLGATQRFVATGRYSDGSAQDLSAQVSWTTSAPAVLELSNVSGSEGLGTARTQGQAVVTAQLGAMRGQTEVTVTAASLARIEFTPSAPRLAKDTRLTLRATGVWSDGATQELSTGCTWSTNNPVVATVSNAPGRQGRVSGLSPGTADIGATCQGVFGSVSVTVTNATLTSIELSPATPSAAAGFTASLTATGVFSDGSTQPFTDFVSWSSSDPARATVSQLGVVSARMQGPVQISATALGVTGSLTFQVSAAVLDALALAPSPAAVPKGLTQAFEVVGTFSDGSTATLTEAATWSSSAPAIATVSNGAGSRGLATAISEGVTTLSASLGGKSVSATLTVTPAALVSLAVTPPTPSLARGLTQQLAATGTFTDGSTRDLTGQVTWSAGDGAIASVSNADGSRGLARALAQGNTALIASLNGTTAQASLTVTAAELVSIGVTPANPSIPRGLSQALQATGVYTDGSTQDLTAQATWSSSNPTRASVSNAAGTNGLVQALELGSLTLTATFSGLSGSTGVTVSAATLQGVALTPPSPSIAAGLSLGLTATGTYSDGSTQVLTSSAAWSSSDLAIATVSGGTVSALRVGTSTITATVGGVSGQVVFTVSSANLTQLQVTPQNVSRPKGVPQQFTATGLFTDGSNADLTSTVTWSSSDGAKLSISNASGSKGLGSTLGTGGVTIFATHAGITGSTPFTITAAALTGVSVTPGGSTASLGSVRQYTATGTYTDGSTLAVTAQATWSSTNTAVATVSNANGSRGLATTLATGATTIRATLGGFTASSNLVVIQNALSRIDLTPAAGSTALGYSRQFIAIGTYNDGTTQVLTNQVTWSGDDANVAILSNADGSRGLLSTVGTGSITVSATFQGVTGSTAHTVSPAVLVYLAVTPGSASVGAGGTVQLTAEGTFSDGSQQDLTAAVTWTSSQQGVAQVSNAAGSEGLVSGLASGTSTIDAALGGVSASITVTVP